MRWLNLALAGLMLVFMGVQYNDPDGLMWIFIYAIPMLWALIAVIRPAVLRLKLPRLLLWLCMLASALLVLYYWPKTPGWWKSEVWWEVETAREGMGMMIVLIVLSVVMFSTRRRGDQVQASEQSDLTD